MWSFIVAFTEQAKGEITSLIFILFVEDKHI